ncbi:prolyl oligopeptidase family serine peptidase [uncultured Tateyamaria sp.]|uniref:alpha/beta hydrolase family esterase n=1 Tax=uncultured Tateyamaria sp. TaxID=455651 RepID=UPI0026349B8E|nr:prolyl oligopeptidase family serine peptidase [uncultured Tateyamaria sp.]
MRFALAFALLVFGLPVLACGPDTNCEIGARHYRIAMPEGVSGSVGAIVFAHGYRGSARGVMRNMGLRRMVADMGLALIAPKSARDDWDIPGAPSDMASTGALEMAYFEAVIADAAARFAIDPERIMMSGFSAGGMVTWELACQRPDLFAGFAPVSGTFWQGPPAACAAPASVIHIHGTTDRTVPIGGRAIGPTKQGDVMEVLAMYRSAGNFGPATDVTVENMDCARQDNASGDVLEFCTFEGGHSFSRTYLAYAWDRLEAAGRL